MKKNLFFSAGLILLSGLLMAQEQLENPGFEEWEDILLAEPDTIREPLHWSSLKESDNPTLATFAPVVCERSTDAHGGMYAVKLTNVQTIANVVANGIVTNGRIHPDVITANAYNYTDPENAQWHTAFTSRPDSIAGWFKYNWIQLDTLQVKVTLHKGFGKQPDMDSTKNWIGVAEYRTAMLTEGNWVRFSAPFKYFSEETPEYVLVVINSGAKWAAAAESVAFFDDLEIIYNTSSVAPPEEAGTAFIAVTGSRTLWLQHMDPTQYRQLDIYSITGQRVLSVPLDSDRVDLSASGLTRGIYILSVNGPGQVYNQKIVLH